MAETLEVNQLLARQSEPKRKFQWILEIDGIDSFTVKTSQRPSIERETVEVDYINQRWYVAGKDKWQPLKIELYDFIAPSSAQKVIEWLRLVHDHSTGRMGYMSMYKRNFSLKMLDPVGNVVEKWNIIGAMPTGTIEFGELDYAVSDLVTAVFTVQPDDCRLEF